MMLEFAEILRQDHHLSHVNIYRTKKYIVHQMLHMITSPCGTIFWESDDVFYARTPERDAVYEHFYLYKPSTREGKRISAPIHTRIYK